MMISRGELNPKFDNDYTRYSAHLLEIYLILVNTNCGQYLNGPHRIKGFIKDVTKINDLPGFKVKDCNSFLKNLDEEILDNAILTEEGSCVRFNEEWYNKLIPELLIYYKSIEEVIESTFSEDELPLRKKHIENLRCGKKFWEVIDAWEYTPEMVNSTVLLERCPNCSRELCAHDIKFLKECEDREVEPLFKDLLLTEPVIKSCGECEKIYFNKEDYETIMKKKLIPLHKQLPFPF